MMKATIAGGVSVGDQRLVERIVFFIRAGQLRFSAGMNGAESSPIVAIRPPAIPIPTSRPSARRQWVKSASRSVTHFFPRRRLGSLSYGRGVMNGRDYLTTSQLRLGYGWKAERD